MTQISIRGARTHNLKNFDLDIPRNQLVVITGPSGSGKSSLAFDTIFAQGQRNYVESLSASARQFISQMPRPDVDSIEGLTPCIAIGQHRSSGNPRSTVGTATELHEFFKILFARAGTPYCPHCDIPIAPLSVSQMVDDMTSRLDDGDRFSILSPIVRNGSGNLQPTLERLKRDGFNRVQIEGTVYHLDEPIQPGAKTSRNLDVVIDRLVMQHSSGDNRLADSLELALRESDGLVTIAPADGASFQYTDRFACASCGNSAPALRPSDFSFNSPNGACPTCSGMGEVRFFDETKIIPEPELSIREGAIAPWSRRNTPYYRQLLDAVTTQYGIDPFKPWKQLSEPHQKILLEGTRDELLFSVKKGSSTSTYRREFEGIIANLERRAAEYEKKQREKSADVDFLSFEFNKYTSSKTCGSCNGARLKSTSLCVRLGDKNMAELLHLSIGELTSFFGSLQLPAVTARIAAPAIKEVNSRLNFLSKVGLAYLQLSRSMVTLSGGGSAANSDGQPAGLLSHGNHLRSG